MSHGKQITLYNHKGGPNGWKVTVLCEELGLTYETIYLDFGKNEHKLPPHIDLNPNGRVPTIIDHKNNDFVLFESNAIMQYLVDTYDTERKLSFDTSDEKYKCLQWLFFQSSGQGPYFGQAVWFTYYHPEKVPSALERYENEMKRVFGVIDIALAKEPSGWLVGGKYSIADMSFVTWSKFGLGFLGDKYDVAKDAPHVDKWLNKILARPATERMFALKETVNKE